MYSSKMPFSKKIKRDVDFVYSNAKKSGSDRISTPPSTAATVAAEPSSTSKSGNDNHSSDSSEFSSGSSSSSGYDSDEDSEEDDEFTVVYNTISDHIGEDVNMDDLVPLINQLVETVPQLSHILTLAKPASDTVKTALLELWVCMKYEPVYSYTWLRLKNKLVKRIYQAVNSTNNNHKQNKQHLSTTKKGLIDPKTSKCYFSDQQKCHVMSMVALLAFVSGVMIRWSTM